MNKIKEALNTFVCDKKLLKEKIDSQINKKQPNIFFALTSFASFIILVGVLTLTYFYNTATSYISIDINPSVVLTANRFDKIIKAEGLNEEAKQILNSLNIKHQDVSDAVNMIVDKAADEGYIDINITDNVVLITTYCNNHEKRSEMHSRIHDSLTNNMHDHGIQSLIIDQELSKEDALKANEYNVSEGKILFVKKALAENPDLLFEDLIYLPTSEIAKYIKGYENLHDNENEHNNIEHSEETTEHKENKNGHSGSNTTKSQHNDNNHNNH